MQIETGGAADSCVQVSCTQPTDSSAKVWVNPCGAAENAESYTPSEVSGIVGLALNEMLNSTAARYATIEDALAGNSATADGKILAFTCGGAFNIMLLDNIESATKISVTKDCTIHLNGKKISFTAAGAYLDINTANEVTINGKVAGSEITMNVDADTNQRMVVAKGTSLHLIGGTYSVYGKILGATCIRSENATQFTMEGCTVIGDISNMGTGTTTTTDGNTAIFSAISYGINTSSPAVIDNCFIKVSSHLTDGEEQTFDYNQTHAIRAVSAELTLINSKITAKSTLLGADVYGIISTGGAKPCTVTDCHIIADGWSDYNVNGKAKTAGVYAIKHDNITIDGGYYWGAREGIRLTDYARLNGGIYAGSQHGGAYISGEDVKIKNAVFRCDDYWVEGEVGWNRDNWNGGAVYCTDNNPNGYIWFDNCRFEANQTTANSGIVLKKQPSNTTESAHARVFLSNATFSGSFGNHLRVDSGSTLWLGKNVQYETTNIGGTLDTTTYAGQEFSFETEASVSNGLLSVKDERGNWVNLSGVYLKR